MNPNLELDKNSLQPTKEPAMLTKRNGLRPKFYRKEMRAAIRRTYRKLTKKYEQLEELQVDIKICNSLGF